MNIATHGTAPSPRNTSRSRRRTLQSRVQETKVRRDTAVAHDERGAILILALAFIVVVSVIVIALTTWATNDLNNTTKFSNVRALDYAATSVAQVAIQNMRYNPIPSTTPPADVPTALSYCWQPISGGGKVSELTFNSVTVAVWCSTYEDLKNPGGITRSVSFYVCQTALTSSSTQSDVNTAASACYNNPLLKAVVGFDDYPPGGSGTLTSRCSGPSSCGKTETLLHWIWATSSTLGIGQAANSITITSSAPGSPVVGGATYTPAATATSGDSPTIASSTGTVCVMSSGVVSFTAAGTCTLTFDDPGNLNYAPATEVTQSFSVGKGTNTIKVTSSTPGSAIVGATYTPTAVATSGDTVAITDSPSGVCTMSAGVVHFVGAGTCTINYNDSGNSSYLAATQVQESVSVTAGSSGSYSGGSNGNIPNTNTYYQVNVANSNGSSTNTSNTITPGVAETLTSISFTMNTSSGTNHTITIGLVHSGTWSATALTCTVTGGQNLTTCSANISVTVPVGYSINAQAIGNGNHSGTWTVTYTQP